MNILSRKSVFKGLHIFMIFFINGRMDGFVVLNGVGGFGTLDVISTHTQVMQDI